MALETNLVANYRLNDVNDNKGSFHLTNNNSVTFTPAVMGNGANFGTANTDKSLSIANDLGVNGNGAQGSINLWVKMLTEIGSGQMGYFDLRDATGLFIFQMYYEYNAGTRRVGFNRQRFAIANDFFTSNLTMGTANFYMFTLTYDGATVTGYVNGSSVGTVASSGNGTSSTTDLFALGLRDTSFASCLIDEVSVWNTRAISGAEVTSLYNSGVGMYFNGTIFVPYTPSTGGAFLLNFI